MQALRMIRETSEEGTLHIQVPKNFGNKVEVIVIPANEEVNTISLKESEMNEEEVFLVASYQAVIEDDEEEDAVWRKYIK
ncbi:MAG: hypothetical protein KGQ83_09685 [Planctomycetes bacterium]|nr:hypothetical protein [Planctomycetota bacterium]